MDKEFILTFADGHTSTLDEIEVPELAPTRADRTAILELDLYVEFTDSDGDTWERIA